MPCEWCLFWTAGVGEGSMTFFNIFFRQKSTAVVGFVVGGGWGGGGFVALRSDPFVYRMLQPAAFTSAAAAAAARPRASPTPCFLFWGAYNGRKAKRASHSSSNVQPQRTGAVQQYRGETDLLPRGLHCSDT